jgi:RES domain-containing protein
MRVWRICQRRFVADALEGTGGVHVSGRWHRMGHPIVYTSTHASLAALEVLVHADPLTAPGDLRLLAIEVPDDIKIESLDTKSLPKDWRALPAPEALQSRGTAWLRSARSAGLLVPSAIIETERNLLLNPRHPDTKRVKVVENRPFSFDPRLRAPGLDHAPANAPARKSTHIRTTRATRRKHDA